MMIRRQASPKPFKGDYARHKRRLERLFSTERDRCREAVYERDGGCCVRCGKPLKLNPSDDGADWYNVANIHEKHLRSLGGSSIDPENCETLCSSCHTGNGHHAK